MRKYTAIRYGAAALCAASLLSLSAMAIHPAGDICAYAQQYVSPAVYADIPTVGESGLDVSSMGPEDMDAICAELDTKDGVVSINFMTRDGTTNFSLEDVKTIHEHAPEARLRYNVTMYGKTFSLGDVEIEYRYAEIGNNGVKDFEELFPLLTKGTKVIFDDCSIDYELLAQLRDTYSNIKIVWRVHFSEYSVRTDTTIIRACGNVRVGSGAEDLKYCTEVKYIDFGHNDQLYDIDFMRYMPHLQILILADAPVMTLEPLSQCHELMFLEIVNCSNVGDLTPLASCGNLRFLNFSNAFSIKDLSPLYGLKHLERLYASRYSVSEDQIAEIRELMPDCLISFGMPEASNVSYNYSVGWRLDDPYTRADWYVELREIFGVVQEYYSRNNNRVPVPTPEISVFVLPED